MISGGTRLGPYEIKDFLGAGGMGEVYRANDTRLDRVVALKLLPMELVGDPHRLRRFEQEARAASALNHPAIVTVYDAGQLGSQPYISMELVAGRTLRDILAPGAMSVRRALQVAAQIADGLAKAHQAGIVHRDLKPENIKLSTEGFAKILDFGLAKHVPDADAALAGNTRTAMDTRPGTLLGTVGYMSPEQARGLPVAFPSDQFSFGAIFYEMLTGRRAFEQPTPAETLSAIIRDHPTSISTLNAAVPSPVRWIVERCLSKDPGDRYTATRDLARDLASAREHLAELLGSGRGRTTRRRAGETSLVVLPLLNLSADPKQEYLADGMTDLLITELSQTVGLRVISRTSSMSYKGQRKTLPEIAEELGVEWVVQGSVAKTGRHMRITAQLVEASTDENRWARTFDRSVRDILALEAIVATAIAREVNAAIVPARSASSAVIHGVCDAPGSECESGMAERLSRGSAASRPDPSDNARPAKPVERRRRKRTIDPRPRASLRLGRPGSAWTIPSRFPARPSLSSRGGPPTRPISDPDCRTSVDRAAERGGALHARTMNDVAQRASDNLKEGVMPLTPHVERHFTSGEAVRDIVIGMSDGLTVPFALAAGLSGAVESTSIVITAGLAEIAAGSIAMGLGGYLAARSDAEHYASERRREQTEVADIPAAETAEVLEIFATYGVSAEAAGPVVRTLKERPEAWVDFMMRFELGLEKPDPKRALVSAATIAGAYIAGGLIPLAPYFMFPTAAGALLVSVAFTLLALFVFGFVKGHFTGARPFRSALQTAFVGGLAAAAAFGIARAIS